MQKVQKYTLSISNYSQINDTILLMKMLGYFIKVDQSVLGVIMYKSKNDFFYTIEATITHNGDSCIYFIDVDPVQ